MEFSLKNIIHVLFQKLIGSQRNRLFMRNSVMDFVKSSLLME